MGYDYSGMQLCVPSSPSVYRASPPSVFFRSATSIRMRDIPSCYFHLALNISFFLISYGAVGKENTLQKKALHITPRIGPGGFF